MMTEILYLLIDHLAFLAIILSPIFWTSLSIYHEEATKSITQQWQQLQLAVNIRPPLTIIAMTEDDSDDEYEQWPTKPGRNVDAL
ncbi:hypothetical protein EG328_002894 [Venturia inaequalis]|uniref:Uncharacterized protein n=1 Tax=Venturia inaequalis TaxID=5025 RepID=A0A8H3YXX1_VENIN|nr:hypothetical protein EG328_002894 [Venturia inaequalis]